MSPVNDIKQLIDDCSDEQCEEILKHVRSRVRIHELENLLNCSAEIILESIARAADITIRGIRGIITEVAFKQEIIAPLTNWQDITSVGELPYDFLLTDGNRNVNIQFAHQKFSPDK